ncbi:MAG: cytochrome P450 [Pseudomonadales bacterium]|jgi:cytochrome P450
MTKTITVSDFNEAIEALKKPDLKQSLYNAGGILMQDVLITLHGAEHIRRRSVESKLFRRNFFSYFENEVFPAILESALEQFLTEKHCDLKQLGYRIMVNLSIVFSGVDRQDNSLEEANALHDVLHNLGLAVVLGQLVDEGERQAAEKAVNDALTMFDERFFQPSRSRRELLIQQVRDGELEEDDLPRDILTVLLLNNNDKLQLSDDLLMREVAFFFLASSHTSVHTITHVMNEIMTWYQDKPEHHSVLAEDILMLQKFVHESMRLHPSSPEARRSAEANVDLASQGVAEHGDTVVISLQEASRDKKIYGADAEEFNPARECPARLLPTGLTFSGGPHVCLGMNLVAGTMLKKGQECDPEKYQYGTIALIAQELLRRGIEFDPSKPPVRDMSNTRDMWDTFPVVFNK